MNAPSSLARQRRPRRLNRGNAADQIRQDLQSQILTGALHRGSKLPTERKLAEEYGVSGATVREAIRSLVTMQLIEVRHGSGAYITADADELLALSLNSLIQLKRIGVTDVLAVLGVLVASAAALAAVNATKSDLTKMERGLRLAEEVSDADHAAAGLTAFLAAVADASHNPLLAVLCRFLVGLQMSLAIKISGGSAESWRKTSGRLAVYRRQVFAAIKARDAKAAHARAEEYHANSVRIIGALPNANSTWIADLKLTQAQRIGR